MSVSPSLGQRLTHSMASSRDLTCQNQKVAMSSLLSDEGAINDGGAVLAGEVDAGAFGRGVKTVVAYQDSGFQELVVEFVHVGHELGSDGLAFSFSGAFDDDHESHCVCPFGLSWSDVQVQSLIAALPIVEREGAESTRRTEKILGSSW